MSKVIDFKAYKEKKENEKAVDPEEPKKDRFDIEMEKITPDEYKEMMDFLFEH